MTCIVGRVTNDGVVLMGADRLGVSDSFSKTERLDKKLFKVGEFGIGFTTSYRMGQLLQYKLKPTTIPDDMDLMEYMVTLFVEDVRKVFKEGGFTQVKEQVELGGSFLVGIRGRLFCIYDNFQVSESADRFDSVGCGSDYALGSMYTSEAIIASTDAWFGDHDILRISLEAAHHGSAGVGDKYDFLGV